MKKQGKNSQDQIIEEEIGKLLEKELSNGSKDYIKPQKQNRGNAKVS